MAPMVRSAAALVASTSCWVLVLGLVPDPAVGLGFIPEGSPRYEESVEISSRPPVSGLDVELAETVIDALSDEEVSAYAQATTTAGIGSAPPSASAFANTSDLFPGLAIATASVIYDVRLVKLHPDAPDIEIPLLFSSSLSAATGSSLARLRIGRAGETVFQEQTDAGDVLVQSSISLLPVFADGFTVEAFATAGDVGGESATASATAPVFSIDPQLQVPFLSDITPGRTERAIDLYSLALPAGVGFAGNFATVTPLDDGCLPDPGILSPDGGSSVSSGGAVTCRKVDPSGFRTYDAAEPIDGLQITVTSGSTVRSDVDGNLDPDGAVAFGLLGDGHSLENDGEILALGEASNAIFVGGDAFDLANRGLIETQANESEVIWIVGDLGGVANLGGGEIRSQGVLSSAVVIEGDDAFVSNQGTIQTSGAVSSAIVIEGDGATLENLGDVATSAVFSAGVVVLGDDSVELGNAGRIVTLGNDAWGMLVVGLRDDVVNGAGGRIDTAGNRSHGIALGLQEAILPPGADIPPEILDPATGSVTNAGLIATTGNDADAIHLNANGSTAINVGRLEVSGAGAHGVSVGGAGNSLRNAGTIEASGAGGHGMESSGTNNTLTNTGSIDVEGSGGAGLAASGRLDTLSNDTGAFIGVQGGAAGMRHAGSSGLVSNEGTIDVVSAGSDGIVLLGDFLTASNGGRIEVGGAGGSGIRVSGSDDLVTNHETGEIVTTADGSSGVFVVTGGRVQNFGAVRTFGDDSSALLVGEGLGRVTNDGSVSTIGDRAHGIEVGRTQPVSTGRVNHTGTIATEGVGADGMHVSGAGFPIVIGATGGIATSGSDADGVELRGGANTLDNAGEIVVTGAGAAGVRMETTGALQAFFNTGSVSSSADAFAGSAGAEAVFHSGTIVGDVRLQGGDDLLQLSDGYLFDGVAYGGAGLDELQVDLDSIETLAGGRFVEFETFRKVGSGLLALTELLSVDLGLVEEGTLAVTSGSTLRADSGVTVGSNGTLLGNGTVDGEIVVDPGGTLGPGLSIGHLTVSGDVLVAGSLQIELGGSDPGQLDVLQVLGSVSFLETATLQLDFVDGFLPTLGETMDFLLAGALLGTGGLDIVSSGLPAGYAFELAPTAEGLSVVTAAVPEPATGLLVALGLAGLAARREAVRPAVRA